MSHSDTARSESDTRSADGQEEVEQRPNVLIIIADQHNYRAFGSQSGDDRGEPVSTSTFDTLAANSVCFENTYCPVPVCAPSRLAFLTGRTGPNAGAWDNHSVLRPSLDTLPESLSDTGYETCLVGKMHLGGNRQFVGFNQRPYGDLTGQGGHQLEPPNADWDFHHPSFVTDVGETNVPESLTQDRTVAQESLAFIREYLSAREDQPYFLCASFNRPHWPRTAPRRFLNQYWPDGATNPRTSGEERISHPVTDFLEERHVSDDSDQEDIARARAAYFACVEYIDEVIGDFLHTLDRDDHLENTIVIYMSDHGDMIGEHGLWDKRVWYDDASRVPFFVQLPEHRDSERNPGNLSTPVNLIDLFPTVCGLTETDAPGDLDGIDLSEAIRTEEEPDRDPVFSDGLFDYEGRDLEYRMVREGKYKYVHCFDAPDLLFDLEADPDERINLIDSATDDAAEARSRLRELVVDSIDIDEVTRKKERDEKLKTKYRLGIPKGQSNAYQFPDGRIVDADSPLYHPHVLAEELEVVFDDYPDRSN